MAQSQTVELSCGLTIDVDFLKDRLSGRSTSLRTSKPRTDRDNGLVQYVWRMARFHSGADTCMPVTATFDLSAYLEDQGIDASVSGIVDETGETLIDELDDLVDALLIDMGLSPMGAAKRYEGILY